MRAARVMARRFVTLALGLLADPTQAENARGVAVGDRVRLHTSSATLVGTVQRLTADELAIDSPGSRPTLVRRGELRRLQISQGRSAAKAARTGLIVGSVIGAGLGLWYKAALEETESSSAFILLPLIGAGMVGATGAGVGALAKQEVWQDVPMVAVSQNAGGRSVGVRLSMSFRF